MKLNLIDENTEITSTSTKNETKFTINVGLHPKDSDRIIEIICNELNNGCEKTKAHIQEFNEELENIKNQKKHNG